MTATTIRRILAIGAITGMRSMSGVATLAARHGRGVVQRATLVMAAGEMAADKTSAVGNRTDALPLAGRAVIGAALGALIAHEERDTMLLGAALGAATAIVATHAAFRLRTHAPFSSATAGLLEDAVVTGAGALYAKGQLT